MRRTSLFIFIVMLAASGFAPAGKPAQTGFTIKSKTEAVTVDVVVKGPDGRFVPGLRLEDFELWEDGKRQELTNCRLTGPELEPAGNAPPEESRSGTGDETQPDGATNASARGRSVHQRVKTVIAFDMFSLQPGDLILAKQAISSYLREQVAPGDEFMLVAVGHQIDILQEFSGDPERLAAALEKVRPSSTAWQYKIKIQDIANEIALIENEPELALSILRTYLGDCAMCCQTVTGQLRVLCRYLGSLTGRKQLVYLSQGYALQPEVLARETARLITIPDDRMQGSSAPANSGASAARISAILGGAQQNALTSYLQQAIDEANRNQVSIYTVDTRGMIAIVPGGAAEYRTTPSTASIFRELNEKEVEGTHSFLFSMAEETGGKASLNSNDLSRSLGQAARDGRQYYMLAYQSNQDRHRSGWYHRLKVRVKRPDVSVTARKGYFDMDENQLLQQDLANALKFPALFRNPGMTIREEYADGRLTVQVRKPSRMLELLPAADELQGEWEVYVGLLGRDNRLAGGRWINAKHYTLTLNQEELKAFRRYEYLTGSLEGTVKPGEYTLSVIVREKPSGRMSVLTKLLKLN